MDKLIAGGEIGGVRVEGIRRRAEAAAEAREATVAEGYKGYDNHQEGGCSMLG